MLCRIETEQRKKPPYFPYEFVLTDGLSIAFDSMTTRSSSRKIKESLPNPNRFF